MRTVRSALAIVLGYAVMLAGAWVGQESIYPDTEYGAPLLQLLTVGIMTSLLAATGGARSTSAEGEQTRGRCGHHGREPSDSAAGGRLL